MLSRPTSRPLGFALALLAGLALGGDLQAGSPPRSHSHRPAPKLTARPALRPAPKLTARPKTAPRLAAKPAPRPGHTKAWPRPVVKYPRHHAPAGLRPTWGTHYRRLPGCVAGRGWYGRFSRGHYIPCNYPYWTHRTYCARYRVQVCYDRVTRGWYYRSARYGCFVPYSCVATEHQCAASSCQGPQPEPVPPPEPEPEPEQEPEPEPQPVCVKTVSVKPVCVKRG